jgi:hypothetical protein
MRIDWMHHHHEDAVILLNNDVDNVIIQVVVKGWTYVLCPSSVSSMFM